MRHPRKTHEPAGLRPLLAPADLDLALARSELVPQLLFKHSTSCGLSLHAYEEVATLARGQDSLVEICLLRVREQRRLSDAIAERLGVRHESPQVLLLRKGRVAWHASHFRVTAAEIRKALSQLVHESSPEPR